MADDDKEKASDKEVNKAADEEAKAKSEDKAKEKSFSQSEVEKLVAKELAKFKDYDDLKKENDSLKKEKLNDQEKALEEVKEAKEKEFEPVKTRVAKLEASMQELLDLEMADVPEDKQHLVSELMPESLSPEDKVAWIKKAKAGGIFGSSKKDSSTATKPGEAPKGEAEKVDSKKLAKENPAKYAEYLKEKYGVSVRIPTKKKTKRSF